MEAPLVRRVAVLTHVAALSGAELALSRMVKHLERRRYVPVVVTFAEGPLVQRLRNDGIETAVLPLAAQVSHARRGNLAGSVGPQLTRVLAGFVPALARTLRGLDVDLIHSHSLKADLMSVAVAPLVRVPLVWHVHDRISDDYLPASTVRLVRALAHRVPRHVVANSHATLQTLMPLKRWTVAYPGLESASFAPRTGTPAERVVGILGRIGPTKGQDLFLRAAAAIRQSHPDVRFRVIGTPLFGEGDYEEDLRRLCRELGMDDTVEFTGFVEDPAAALRDLSVCVHASPLPEPFGQVIVEAMAAGVPTVVSDAGGASEIVRDRGELLARLASPGSVEDIQNGVCWILDHDSMAADMSARALASVRRRFGIEQTCATVMNAWDSVVRR